MKEFTKTCGNSQMIREIENRRPKKALSAYMIFVRETRAKVCKNYPDMHALEIMKEVGQLWQNLTPKEKQEYESLANEDKIRFKKDMEVFEKEINELQEAEDRGKTIFNKDAKTNKTSSAELRWDLHNQGVVSDSKKIHSKLDFDSEVKDNQAKAYPRGENYEESKILDSPKVNITIMIKIGLPVPEWKWRFRWSSKSETNL